MQGYVGGLVRLLASARAPGDQRFVIGRGAIARPQRSRAERAAIRYSLDRLQPYTELDATAADLFDAVGTGKLKIAINQRYPLAAAAEAHRALEGRRTIGATILSL
ncbi:MAG: zinc-binding dehydrogenase [Steroidobacteraceae bacterium]